MRLAVWLRDGNGDNCREAEWVMLFIKCSKNEYVSECRKCKNKTKRPNHISYSRK